MTSPSSDYETLTALHFRKLSESDPGGNGNEEVHRRLGELGVGLVLVPNATAYHISEGMAEAHPILGSSIRDYDPNTVELPLGEEGISVIRARVSTPPELEVADGIKVLNGPSLRAIGASKWRQYQLAQEFMPPTVLTSTKHAGDINQLLGNKFVVKADMSQLSRDCLTVSRAEAKSTAAVMQTELLMRPGRTNSDVIVQTFAHGDKWPGLKGRTERADLLLKRAQSQEVRVYCFVTDKDTDLPIQAKYYATGRAFRDNEDKWAEIDQNSVPQKVWEISEIVSQRLLREAGVSGGYFAIDFIQTALQGHDEANLLIREINTRDPMMVTVEEGAEDARIQRHMLAELMARI